MADVRRGDIVWCDFEADARPGEAGRRRPALVVSSDRMSHFAPVAVLPLTTTRRPYPTCVELADALPRTSYVQCEQVRAVSRTRIGPVIGRVDIATMRRIEAVLRRVLGL